MMNARERTTPLNERLTPAAASGGGRTTIAQPARSAAQAAPRMMSVACQP